jgi:hypothetical protein
MSEKEWRKVVRRYSFYAFGKRERAILEDKFQQFITLAT